MGMSNPFSFATLRPPSHGGAVNLSKTNTSPTVMPPKERLIGDVALILMPKFPATEREALASILTYYPELLGYDYIRVAESPNWILYRRANTGIGSGAGNPSHRTEDSPRQVAFRP
jgi:hypothetical protein